MGTQSSEAQTCPEGEHSDDREVSRVSSGDFIIHERNLLERNRWFQVNAEEVAPYLQDGRDCIIFTFSRQEPSDRMTTRVGGLPYWPREQPWPACGGCSQLLTFAAQLDFRDPRIRPTVPGDVLTFHYCFSCFPWSPDDPGGWLLTWHKAMSSEQLIAAAEIPQVSEEFQFGPFYGHSHDAVDYPVPDEAYGGRIAGEEWTYLQFTLQGTKIGGYPPPIQPFDTPVDSQGRPMRFLAAIGSVQGYEVDQVGNAVNSQGDLLWGDMGCVYLWISEDITCPEMTWFIECY